MSHHHGVCVCVCVFVAQATIASHDTQLQIDSGNGKTKAEATATPAVYSVTSPPETSDAGGTAEAGSPTMTMSQMDAVMDDEDKLCAVMTAHGSSENACNKA